MKNADQPMNPVETYKLEGDDIKTEAFTGLTKREHFSGIALLGLLSANNSISKDYAVKRAIEYADELLNQLETTK